MDFADLNARARGLGTRLFPRAALETLAGFADPALLAAALERSGRLSGLAAEGAAHARIEAAVRQTAARHLRTLARWCGERAAALEVFYADQDRRSLRALLRGAVQGVRPEARLAGLVPTPRLPERALDDLARRPTPREIVRHLVALGDPYAGALAPLVEGLEVDLAELELALVRVLASRLRAAADAGDRALRDYARLRIDLANAQAALLLARERRDLDPAKCFVEGGRAIERATFVAAANATPADAPPLLARALAGTPLGALFEGGVADPVALEAQALARLLGEQRRHARLDPLSSAPLVLFLLRLEAQSRDLLAIASGAALGVPEAHVRSALVTPWN
jgi:vacuolar-type H+-ATPase subunit C/Vma6